jgi:XTP/dITP diphosphohydrolase
VKPSAALRLVVASANPDKVAEIAAVLEPVGIVLEPRPASVPDVVEDADSLEGNARLKAVAIAEATGSAAVADDTGLEVDALEGAPGVRSARYAGEDVTYAQNVEHLLAELRRVGADRPEQRRARFRTIAMVRWPDGREVAVSGAVEGHIADAPRGPGGFGYDPVFVPDDAGDRTFAEMAPAEKHAISHRGRAFRGLAEKLARGDGGPRS